MIKFIKRWIANIKYNWSYLEVLNSPFKGLRLKWYFGKIQHGTPYFLPRKFVKCDMKDALKAWMEMSINSRIAYEKKDGGRKAWVKNYVTNYTKPVPIKYFGLNSCTLGWKTKWDDYRYEWSPCYSLVIFGKQLFLTVLPNVGNDIMKLNVYWEAWLNYRYKTDKTKSKEERLQELFKKHSCTWIQYKDKKEIKTDYYPFILKEKYLKNYIKDE